MKIICDFCKKEYEWIEGQSNWGKFGLKNGKGSVNSKKYCCYECGKKAYKENCKKTNLEKYGVENPFQAEQFKEKSKQTLLEKYGVDNSMKLKATQEKAQQTCLKHYGKKFSAQVKECFDKVKKTKLERYGDENFINKEKAQQTKLEKYGDPYYYDKEKFKKTMNEKYGVDYFPSSNKYKEKTIKTNLEKYGTEWSFQSEEVKNKAKQTLLNKYNVDNYSKTEEYKEKTIKTNLEKYGTDYFSQSQNGKEKIKKYFQQNYGVDSYIKTEEFKIKAHESKKKNNSYGKSNEEDEVYMLLCNKFGENNIDRQYTSSEYPFECDFYILNKDIYIEYQGFWSHGKEPFDKDNIAHQEKLNIWLNRSNDISLSEKRRKYYKNAIKTWTINDVKKRQVAKENNLNWKEFWTVEEVKDWINSF